MGKIIGISGGVASGKTTAGRILGELGAHVIDADRIGHEVLRLAAVKRRIVAKWGAATLDESGEIDRKKLGRMVFSDEASLKALEGIVHPAILRRIRSEIKEIARKDPGRVIVLDAALLNESGLAGACDGVIFIEAGAEARSARVAERGWDAGEVARREARQMEIADKRACADWIVDNSGSIGGLEAQLKTIWQEITGTR